MSMSRTPSEFPGWYVDFQIALLKQAPRPGNGPGQINQDLAERLSKTESATLKNIMDVSLRERFEPKRIALLGDVVATCPEDFIAVWVRFYKEVFKINLKLPTIIPNYRFGFDFLEIVSRGLNHDMITDVECYPTKKYRGDLDGNIDWEKEERLTTQSYAVWCVDNGKKLPIGATYRGTSPITLLERRLQERFCYWTARNYFGQEIGLQQCLGSRFLDGTIPGVYNGKGGFCIVRSANARYPLISSEVVVAL